MLFLQIKRPAHKKGDDLPEHRCKSSPFNAQIKDKDKVIIQNDIDNAAKGHRAHGVKRRTVVAHQGNHPRSKDLDDAPDQYIAQVSERNGEKAVLCAQ